MIPGSRLSFSPVTAPFLGPRNDSDVGPMLDREIGGIGLQNPSAGLLYQSWLGLCNGSQIIISAPNTAPTVVISDLGISEFSFSFDQNMNIVVSYVALKVAKLNWFDLESNQQVTTVFDRTYRTPKVSLDDKHRLAGLTSDVIFAYIRNGLLYYRQQRDRYSVEYPLAGGEARGLRRIGMNIKNRFQFDRLYPTETP